MKSIPVLLTEFHQKKFKLFWRGRKLGFAGEIPFTADATSAQTL
jgi:hypothetical protein